MKNIITAIAVTVFITLGFTIVNTPIKKKVSKVEYSEGIDFSSKLDEKRLASWD